MPVESILNKLIWIDSDIINDTFITPVMYNYLKHGYYIDESYMTVINTYMLNNIEYISDIISIAHWIENSFRRTSDHNHKYKYLNF